MPLPETITINIIPEDIEKSVEDSDLFPRVRCCPIAQALKRRYGSEGYLFEVFPGDITFILGMDRVIYNMEHDAIKFIHEIDADRDNKFHPIPQDLTFEFTRRED